MIGRIVRSRFDDMLAALERNQRMSDPQQPPTMYWHEKGCQCPGCQQERLRAHYGPPRARYEPPGPAWRGWVAGSVIVGLVVLALLAYVNPHVNVPVISPVVCSLKGATWYGGGILGPPGCYVPGMGG